MTIPDSDFVEKQRYPGTDFDESELVMNMDDLPDWTADLGLVKPQPAAPSVAVDLLLDTADSVSATNPVDPLDAPVEASLAETVAVVEQVDPVPTDAVLPSGTEAVVPAKTLLTPEQVQHALANKARLAAEEREQERRQQQGSQGQAGKSNTAGLGEGVSALMDGAGAVLGGMGQLGGAALGFVGGGLNMLASRPAVLPRLSEYRATQLENTVSNYQRHQEYLWNHERTNAVRQKVQAQADLLGVSKASVIAEMRPGGAHEALHAAFVDACAGHEGTAVAAKNMQKAMASFERQRTKAGQELLSNDSMGNPMFDRLKERVSQSETSMLASASETPLLPGEDHTHLERIQGFLKNVFEMVQGLFNKLSPSNAAAPAEMSPH